MEEERVMEENFWEETSRGRVEKVVDEVFPDFFRISKEAIDEAFKKESRSVWFFFI